MILSRTQLQAKLLNKDTDIELHEEIAAWSYYDVVDTALQLAEWCENILVELDAAVGVLQEEGYLTSDNIGESIRRPPREWLNGGPIYSAE